MLNSYLISVNNQTAIASAVASIALPRKGIIRKICIAAHWLVQPTAAAYVQFQLALRSVGQFNASIATPTQILDHSTLNFGWGTAVGFGFIGLNKESALAQPINTNDVIYMHTSGTVGGTGTYGYNALVWSEES